MGRILQRKELECLLQSKHFQKKNFGRITGNDKNTLTKIRDGEYDLTYNENNITVALLRPVLASDSTSRARFKLKYPKTAQRDIGLARIYAKANNALEQDPSGNSAIAFKRFVIGSMNDDITLSEKQRAVNLHYMLLSEEKFEFKNVLAQKLQCENGQYKNLKIVFKLLLQLAPQHYTIVNEMLLALVGSSDFSPKITGYLGSDDDKTTLIQLLKQYPKLGKALIKLPEIKDKNKFKNWIPILDKNSLKSMAEKNYLTLDSLVQRVCKDHDLLSMLYAYVKELTKDHLETLLTHYVPDASKLVFSCQKYHKKIFKIDLSSIIKDVIDESRSLKERQKSLAYYLLDCQQSQLIYQNMRTIILDASGQSIGSSGDRFFQLMDPKNPNIDPVLAKKLFNQFIGFMDSRITSTKNDQKQEVNCKDLLNDYLEELISQKSLSGLQKPPQNLLQLLRTNKSYSDAFLKQIKNMLVSDPASIQLSENLVLALHHDTFNHMLQTNLARRTGLKYHSDIEHYISGKTLVEQLLQTPPHSKASRELATTILQPRGFKNHIKKQLFSWDIFNPELGFCYIEKIDKAELWRDLIKNDVFYAKTAFRYYLSTLKKANAKTMKKRVSTLIHESPSKGTGFQVDPTSVPELEPFPETIIYEGSPTSPPIIPTSEPEPGPLPKPVPLTNFNEKHGELSSSSEEEDISTPSEEETSTDLGKRDSKSLFYDLEEEESVKEIDIEIHIETLMNICTQLKNTHGEKNSIVNFENNLGKLSISLNYYPSSLKAETISDISTSPTGQGKVDFPGIFDSPVDLRSSVNSDSPVNFDSPANFDSPVNFDSPEASDSPGAPNPLIQAENNSKLYPNKQFYSITPPGTPIAHLKINQERYRNFKIKAKLRMHYSDISKIFSKSPKDSFQNPQSPMPTATPDKTLYQPLAKELKQTYNTLIKQNIMDELTLAGFNNAYHALLGYVKSLVQASQEMPTTPLRSRNSPI